jgi:hypothetical protein
MTECEGGWDSHRWEINVGARSPLNSKAANTPGRLRRSMRKPIRFHCTVSVVLKKR